MNDDIQEQKQEKSKIDTEFEKKINGIDQSSLEPIKNANMSDIDTILTEAVSKYELNQLNKISYLMSLGVCGLTGPLEKGDIQTDSDGEDTEVKDEDHPEFILLYQFVEYMKKTTSDVNEYLINESLINDSLTSMQTELDKLKTYTQKVTDAKDRLDEIIKEGEESVKDNQPQPINDRKCLISFAWEYSAQTEFEKMIFAGLDKSKTTPKYNIKGGDNPQIENLKEPMPITKRLIIFVCILTSLACLMGLYHNITKIYNSLNDTFQNTDESLRKELFGSDSFDIILFMRLMGQMLSNTFQTTLENLQESGIKQRLLQLSTNINNNLIQSASATLKTDPNNLWDFGIINSVVDVLSGTLQSRMFETAGIEQEYMLSALQNEITATVKREFVEKRYLLANTFETIIYCINGLTVSTVIALNQYKPELVSAESVKIVSAASASVMASNSLLARISGLTSGSAVLGKAIWTLAVGSGNKQSSPKPSLELTEGMSPLKIEAEIPHQLYLRMTDEGQISVVDKNHDILGVLNKGMPIEDIKGGRRRRKMNKNKKREKTIKRVRMIKYSNNTSKRKRSKQNRSKKFVVSKSIQKSTKSRKSKKSTK